MHVRRLQAAAWLLAGLFITPLPASLYAQDFSDVEIQTHPLTDAVYMLTGQGGNIGVSVGEDGVFLIDDQYAPLTDKIIAALAEISDQPVRFVLNTHWHGDHTGGNEPFGQAGALIVAHDNVRERMSVEQFNTFTQNTTPPSPPDALPVVTFSETVTFHLNGDALHAVHVPNAHTDGDALIHFVNANVLHMGDTFFAGNYPYIDLASGGSIDGLIAAANRALGLTNDTTQIIPGHGPVSSPDDLRAYLSMLTNSRARVQTLVREGKTLDEVKAARPTEEYDEAWGQGFIDPERFVETLYQDLSAQSDL